ncbi:MAG: DsbA family protein [Alphaproteobacteria bacterium]
MARYNKSSSFPFILFLIVVLGSLAFIFRNHIVLKTNVSQQDASNVNEIEQIVKDVIKNSPELIISSLENYQIKQQQDMEEKSKSSIINKKQELEDAQSPSSGNIDADVTIVGFFDYKCGHCKKASNALSQILFNDKKIKMIYKELPILGETSREAAKAALAVYKLEPKKYSEFHNKLMAVQNISNESISKLIEDLNIDKEKWEAAKSDSFINEELEKNRNLARELNIQGTPAFIINGELIPGSLPVEGFKEKINNARARKS